MMKTSLIVLSASAISLTFCSKTEAPSNDFNNDEIRKIEQPPSDKIDSVPETIFSLEEKFGDGDFHSDSQKNLIDIEERPIESEPKIKKNQYPIPNPVEPVLGYRYHIIGDFDGDGKEERLSESYRSAINHKETNKLFSYIPDYKKYQKSIAKKKPYSFLKSNNTIIDSLFISDDENNLGLLFLKNEGDLNNDGNDEISYVPLTTNKSHKTTCYIMTYTKNGWKKIYEFPTYTHRLPRLPAIKTDYGLLTTTGLIQSGDLDKEQQSILMERRLFKGLIQKSSPNSFSYSDPNVPRSEEVYITVDLSKSDPINQNK